MSELASESSIPGRVGGELASESSIPGRVGGELASESSIPGRVGGRADQAACNWDQDLAQAGVTLPSVNATFAWALPSIALAMFGAAALLAVLTATGGIGLVGVGLIGLAAAPWTYWLVHGDEGPTWTFGILAFTPIAALGVGHWFVPALGPHSTAAYLVLGLPVLLVVLIVQMFAGARLAVGLTALGYLAYGVPLLVGTVVAGEPVYLMLAWHTVFALTVGAGYAVRLANLVHTKIGEAKAAKAAEAAADERRRIAQDVHDVVAHTLAITMLHITAARMAVRRSAPADAEEALVEAERHGRASLTDIRRVVQVLRAGSGTATDAAQPGLADVVALADSYRAAGLSVRLSVAFGGSSVPETTQLAVYRVLQEALANAARHGGGPATVDLTTTADAITLRVGNPLRAKAERGSGSGLVGMRERIGAAGGTIDAGVDGGHWVVRAAVPAQ